MKGKDIATGNKRIQQTGKANLFEQESSSDLNSQQV